MAAYVSVSANGAHASSVGVSQAKLVNRIAREDAELVVGTSRPRCRDNAKAR